MNEDDRTLIEACVKELMEVVTRLDNEHYAVLGERFYITGPSGLPRLNLREAVEHVVVKTRRELSQ